MLYLPTEQINPGMVLAKDIYVDACYLPLLMRGQVISDFMIRRIQLMEIPGVYVESSFCGDIEVESVVSEKLKREVIGGVKEVFVSFSRRASFTDSNVKSVSHLAQKLVTDLLSNEEILINMLELKSYNSYTYYHSLCVAIISVAIGVRLGMGTSQLTQLSISALLHDIGKTMTPIEVLDKPGRLTAAEFDLIKKHPANACALLSANKNIPFNVLSGIKSHHEKFDGTGYPNRLKGHAIPLFGRILAVADVYDALTSKRPYRKACYPKEAIEYMMGSADSHFDGEILDAFLHSVAAYPAGTLVLLSNGKRAVAVKTWPENTLRPLVRLVDDGDEGTEIDLLHDPNSMNITILKMDYEDNDEEPIPDNHSEESMQG